MKAGSRPQYYRIRRMIQMVRDGSKSGVLPNSKDFMREFGVSRRTVARDSDFLRDEENAPVEYDEIRTDEILMVRRQGTGRLRSTFVSVMEVLSGRTSPLSAVRRLALASSDPSAVALEVRHERGTDIIIHALEHGPHHVTHRAMTLEGRWVVIRRAPAGTVRVLMLEGRLKYGRQQIEAPGPQTARVTMVDPRAMTIHLNQPLGPSPTRLAGQFVGVRGHTGRTEHWRVASVSASGRALTLDADHSRLITLQGIIETIENRCYFMTGVNFCVPPESGAPLRIGRVGNFSTPRYHIVDAQQTGLAIRVAAVAT